MTVLGKSAHDIFSALDQDLRALTREGHEPLLSRQLKLSQEILAVFAVRKSDGRHVLFLQCDQQDARNSLQYPTWQGISVEFSGFENTGIEGCFVRIEQGEGSDDEVYFAVVDDLCSCLHDARRSDLRRQLWDALDRWKHFFTLRSSIKLSREEQLGLFGELWLLRSMLQHQVGTQSVEYWKGPYHGVFDFALEGMSIEVKTTASKMPYRIHISSEAQLDDRLSGGRLVLCFLAVQTSDASGETLLDAASAVEEQAKEDPSAFRICLDKLFGCGLGKPFVEEYRTRYIIKHYGFFEVGTGFPRLLHDDLPTGLGDLSYSLEMSACESFRMDEDEFWRIAAAHSKEAPHDA